MTNQQILAAALVAEFDVNGLSERFDAINRAFCGYPRLLIEGGHCEGYGFLCDGCQDSADLDAQEERRAEHYLRSCPQCHSDDTDYEGTYGMDPDSGLPTGESGRWRVHCWRCGHHCEYAESQSAARVLWNRGLLGDDPELTTKLMLGMDESGSTGRWQREQRQANISRWYR